MKNTQDPAGGRTPAESTAPDESNDPARLLARLSRLEALLFAHKEQLQSRLVELQGQQSPRDRGTRAD